MGNQLPPPPVPIDADLRHFPNMPLEVGRLRDSEIAGVADAEVFRCAVLLWGAAWHQIPAGSLPDDNPTLARLAGLGRDLKTWNKLREQVLRGFRKFSDGRLYHRVVCEKVIDGLNSSLHHEWLKACARIRKENHKRTRQTPKLDKLPNPEKSRPFVLVWPTVTEHEPDGGGNANRTRIRPERNGMDIFHRESLTATPHGTVTDTSSLAAERPRADGAAHDGSGEVVNLIARVAAAKSVPA